MNTILCMLLLSISTSQFDYQFSTTKSEIEKKHRLTQFTVEHLDKNILKFFGQKRSKNFEFYVSDYEKMTEICSFQFNTYLGFYNDTLFMVIRSTDELSTNIEKEDPECLDAALINSDNALDYKIRYSRLDRETRLGGNIFGEACSTIKYQFTDKYIYDMNSTGHSVFSKSHNQFIYFIIDRTLTDRFYNIYKVHPENHQHLNPADLFVFTLFDTFDLLQKPIKEQ